jgi:hypothetical protein
MEMATYHVVNWLINPPTKGPRTGPRNGAAVYSIIGARIWLGMNKSETVPAATVRNALPAIPSKKRPTNRVCMFLATAQGMVKIRKKVNDGK